jgi:hypothetical protein
MAGFAGGAASWILDGGSGPRALHHVGAIDVALLVLLLGGAVVAQHVVHRARRSAFASVRVP